MSVKRNTMLTALAGLVSLALAHAAPPAPAPAGPAKVAAKAAEPALDPLRTEAVAEVEFGGIDQDGVRGNIREYDRRRYSPGDIRRLQVDHYAKSGMFKLLVANPLTSNWTDLLMRWHGDELNARYEMSFLTHNMTSEFQNYVVDGRRQLMFPVVTANSAAGDAQLVAVEVASAFNPNTNRRDINLGFDFYLNRQEHDARLDWGRLWDKRLRLSYWAEREYGLPEVTGPNRRNIPGFSTVEHPQTSFAHPVRRHADELEVGADGRWKKAALHGSYMHCEVDDDTPDLPTLVRGGGAADLRPGTIVFPEREMDGFRAGVTYPLGDDVKVRFNHVSRDKSNRRNGYDLDFDTFTASADWSPVSGWSVFSQYRDYRRKTQRNAAFLPVDSVNILPLAPPGVVNESTLQGVYDESTDEFELGFRYGGWEKHTLQAGYRHEKIRQPNAFRDVNALTRVSGDQTGHLDYLARGVDNRLLATNASLERGGFYVNANGNPWRRFSYRFNFEDWDANRDYMTRGSALDERNLSANATYDFEPDLQGYVEVINNNAESNGEPYEEYFKSATVGAYGAFHGVGVGLSYTDESFHTTYLANWQQPLDPIGGARRVRGFLTNVDYVDSHNDIYTVSLTPPRWIDNRLGLQLDFTHTNSHQYNPQGYWDTAFASPGAVSRIAGTHFDDFQAIDIAINRVQFRTEYDLRTKKKNSTRTDDALGVDLAYGRWRDQVDDRQSGDFVTTWLTYRHRL